MNTYEELKDKVVVVTGGSKGIGAETARAFARQGALVCVTGRDLKAVDGVVAEIAREGGTATGVSADLTDFAAVENLRQHAEDDLGPVDVVCAFAGGGIARPGPTAATTVEEWHSVIDGNLTATFFTLKSFLPGMQQRGSGSIITMASTAGRQPSNAPGGEQRNYGAPVGYAAAKAGIVMLTRHVATEVGLDGVRVNCVSPGPIRTERTERHMPPQVQERIAAIHPIQRLGQPADVAATALFLASDGASWLTGLTIDVAGGRVTG